MISFFMKVPCHFMSLIIYPGFIRFPCWTMTWILDFGSTSYGISMAIVEKMMAFPSDFMSFLTKLSSKRHEKIRVKFFTGFEYGYLYWFQENDYILLNPPMFKLRWKTEWNVNKIWDVKSLSYSPNDCQFYMNSWDRMSAICQPLDFNPSPSKARRVCHHHPLNSSNDRFMF